MQFVSGQEQWMREKATISFKLSVSVRGPRTHCVSIHKCTCCDVLANDLPHWCTQPMVGTLLRTRVLSAVQHEPRAILGSDLDRNLNVGLTEGQTFPMDWRNTLHATIRFCTMGT